MFAYFIYFTMSDRDDGGDDKRNKRIKHKIVFKIKPKNHLIFVLLMYLWKVNILIWSHWKQGLRQAYENM